jgi:hypothetical protein
MQTKTTELHYREKKANIIIVIRTSPHERLKNYTIHGNVIFVIPYYDAYMPKKYSKMHRYIVVYIQLY